jgi:hypothetical protein
LRKALLIGLEVCLLGAVGCGGSAAVPETLVTEVGCVTGSGNEFILTDLDEAGPGRPRPMTEAFLLSGSDREVKAQVGRRVRATGEADPAKVVNVRVLQPMVRVRPKNASGPVDRASATNPEFGKTGEPKVEVGQQLRLEVRRLQVRSVEPTGDECASR